MQNEIREKLIEFLSGKSIDTAEDVEAVADYLIANSVTFKDVPDTNVGEWISVEDRLPDRDGWYITQTNATGRSNGTLPQEFEIRNGFGRWRYRDRISTWNTTHWQPMPQPPKGE